MNRISKPGTPRLGVWMYPDAPADRLVEAVVTAEELGLDEVWIADEGVAREPVPLLAAAASRTSTIALAIGITSPLLRHPGPVASTFATLDELSGGRSVLGFGVGGHQSLEPFGINTDRPVGVLRDAIRLARAVFGRVPTDGYHPPPHAAPARSVPIWVGARGPQLTRLAAREADGLFLSGCSVEELERIIPDVRAIAPGLDIALYQSAINQSAGRDDARRSVSSWDDIGEHLTTLATRWAPHAVGINLVDLADPGVDPVELVVRAAEVLGALRGSLDRD